MKFRKLPVEVEAIRYTGKNGPEVREWVNSFRSSTEVRSTWFVSKTNSTVQTWNYVKDKSWGSEVKAAVYDFLHETWVGVKHGQWVMRGTKGEFYPCDDDGTGEAPLNYERI